MIYNMGQELGRGSFGAVFLASESSSQKKFAIKVIEKSDSSTANQGIVNNTYKVCKWI